MRGGWRPRPRALTPPTRDKRAQPVASAAVAPAPAAAFATPRFKVALLGAGGGIGQPLGLLLKM